MPREDDETIQLKLRFREATRKRIELSAKAKGQSLNAEIVSRLERSLDEDDRQGGPETASLVRSVLNQIQVAESETGRRWFEDHETAVLLEHLMDAAVRTHRANPLRSNKALKNAFEAMIALGKLREAAASEILKAHPEALQSESPAFQQLITDAAAPALARALLRNKTLETPLSDDLTKGYGELEEYYAQSVEHFEALQKPYDAAAKKGVKRANELKRDLYHSASRELLDSRPV